MWYGVTQAYSIIKREMQNAHEMSQSDSKWQFVRGSIISENEVTLLKLTLDQNYDRLQKLIFSNFIFSKGRHLKWQFSYQTAPNNLVLKTSFPTLDYSRKKKFHTVNKKVRCQTLKIILLQSEYWSARGSNCDHLLLNFHPEVIFWVGSNYIIICS